MISMQSQEYLEGLPLFLMDISQPKCKQFDPKDKQSQPTKSQLIQQQATIVFENFMKIISKSTSHKGLSI